MTFRTDETMLDSITWKKVVVPKEFQKILHQNLHGMEYNIGMVFYNITDLQQIYVVPAESGFVSSNIF